MQRNGNPQNRMVATSQKSDFRTSKTEYPQNSEWRQSQESNNKNLNTENKRTNTNQTKSLWQPPQCAWEQKSVSNLNNKESKKSVCPSDTNKGNSQQMKYEQQITKSAPRLFGDSISQKYSESRQTAQRLSPR